jgi:hypothetical protein
MIDFLRNILPSFIGFLSAIIVALIGRMLYDRWRSPKISAYPSSNDPAVAEHVTPHCAFYHVIIRNERKRLGLMVNPVQYARVIILFRDKSGRELFRIPAKWDFRQEPINYKENVVDPSLISQCEFLDINPGSEESFCICIKQEGEDAISGFNAYSYLYPSWKNPKWKLDKGEYYVDIVLNAANAYKEFRFILRNNGSGFKDVELKSCSPIYDFNRKHWRTNSVTRNYNR